MTAKTAEKFVTRRFPEADVYPNTTQDKDGNTVEFFQVIDDADSNNGQILAQSSTEAQAWINAARFLGSKR